MSKALQVLRPETLEQAVQFAERIARSQLVPDAYRGKPADILVAIQMGSELGLGPMQALQSIAVINGRPCMWGDALLGIVQAQPDCEDIQEQLEGDGENMVAHCVVKRRGRTETKRSFSVADAKRAGLWGGRGRNQIWAQYPERMLQMRARAFALRDAFADALRGIKVAEEVRDYVSPISLVEVSTVNEDKEPAKPEESLAKKAKPKTQQVLDKVRKEKQSEPEPPVFEESPTVEEPSPSEESPAEQEPWERAQAMADKDREEGLNAGSRGEASAYETMRKWITSAKTVKRVHELGAMVPTMNMGDDERAELREVWLEKMAELKSGV